MDKVLPDTMASNKLDLTSPSFDPEQVILSSDIVLPYPSAKVYNNLAEFETRVLKRRPLRREMKKDAGEDKSLLLSDANKSTDEPPAATTSSQQKQNVLLRMKTAFNKGPLTVLNKCVQQRIRVKVSIRNYGEVRGTCAGFIVAFDKHWNLAMRDVDETYIKRRTLKTPVLKMLPKECYRIVEPCEYTEETVEQMSVSACGEEDSKVDYSSSEDISVGDPKEKAAVSTPDIAYALFSENSPIKHSEEIVEKEIDKLSSIETSDILQEPVTRLNLEESGSFIKTNEKVKSTDTVNTSVLKMLPKACYRIVETCESTEKTVEQISVSSCSEGESKVDYASSEDISVGDPMEKAAVTTPDIACALFSENSPIKHSEEIIEKETDELSSDILQEPVTRLNLGEALTAVPEKETSEPDNQVVVSRHRRKRRKQPEICHRHVNQLFIRGDNVVFIKLLP